MLAQKKKVPGFGHRVYHTEDPRATHLRAHVARTGQLQRTRPSGSRSPTKSKSSSKPDKKLNANVDFYSASTYHTLGIDVDLFTPIFAISRISGWTAHVIEQLNRHLYLKGESRRQDESVRGLGMLPEELYHTGCRRYYFWRDVILSPVKRCDVLH